MEVEEIINNTVNQTVLKLKMAGLMKDDGKTAAQKTEELLKNYNAFKQSEQPYTIKLVDQIDNAVNTIADDPYIDIIKLYYFEGVTIERVAEQINCSVRTVSRNKNRLIDKLKVILFSDRVIEELFL